jgi:lipoprotein-anchoring transpeptidase ErfK/SrfK
MIDLQNHTLTYEDPILEIKETFPIVGPSYDGRKRYGNQRKFRISLINSFPNWRNPRTGKKYPGGHPNNPLGNTRIRFLNSNGGLRPCSIHGAANVKDLGRNLSKCCIRMLDKDAANLRMLVTYDTVVYINY